MIRHWLMVVASLGCASLAGCVDTGDRPAYGTSTEEVCRLRQEAADTLDCQGKALPDGVTEEQVQQNITEVAVDYLYQDCVTAQARVDFSCRDELDALNECILALPFPTHDVNDERVVSTDECTYSDSCCSIPYHANASGDMVVDPAHQNELSCAVQKLTISTDVSVWIPTGDVCVRQCGFGSVDENGDPLPNQTACGNPFPPCQAERDALTACDRYH